MSWQQWSGGTWPQNVVQGAQPTGTTYTPEQWAQMQQQNWQQWIQWQQQYQQWQQQYGQQYQKSMNALTAQAAVPAPIQPPLPPVDKAPPLPPSQSNPLPPLPPSSTNSIAPPKPPAEENVPSMVPPVNFNIPPPNIKTQTPNNYNKNNKGSIPYQKNTQTNFGRNAGPSNDQKSFDAGSFNKSFGQLPEQKTSPNFAQKSSVEPFKSSTTANNFGSTPLTSTPIKTSENNKTNEWTTADHESIKLMELIDELVEAEKVFDKQFEDWESQFNRWKEQNVQHPDQEQYRQYEKKWENWRKQLLDRREQMRKRKTSLMNSLQKNKSGIKPTSEKIYEELAIKTVQENLEESKKPSEESLLDWENENAQDSNVEKNSTENFLLNSAPKEQRQNRRRTSCIEISEENSNSTFLNSSTNPEEGIPGLDLVKENESEKSENVPESSEKIPINFEALSKGINSILGDTNLMNMLSSIKNSQVLEAKNENFDKKEVNEGQNWPKVDFNKPPPDFGAQKSNNASDNSFGGQNSNLGGHSNFGSQSSNLGGQNSNFGGHSSNFGGHTANPGSQLNFGGQNPNFNSKPPNFGDQTSGQTPNKPEGPRPLMSIPPPSFAQKNFGAPDKNFGGLNPNFGGPNANFGIQFGGPNQSFGTPDKNFGGQDKNYGGKDNFGGSNQFGGPNQSFGTPDKNFGGQEKNFGGQNANFKGSNQFGGPNQSFGTPDKNFASHDNSFGGQNQNFRDQNPNFRGQNSDNFRDKNQDLRGQSTNFGGPNPNFGGQNPNFGGPNSNIGGPKSNFGGPSAMGSQNQDFRGPNQNFGNQNQDFRGPKSKFGGQNPNMEGSNFASSNFGSENPNFKGQNLNFRGPNLGGPNTNFGGPNLGGPNPNLGGLNSGGGQNTNFGGPKPNFGGAHTNFGGSNANMGGQKSNFGGDFYEDEIEEEENIENMDDPFPDEPEQENLEVSGGINVPKMENIQQKGGPGGRNRNNYWDDDSLIFKPMTVIDYGHKSLNRPEDKLFIEPVQTFDYGHTSKRVEKGNNDKFSYEFEEREPKRDLIAKPREIRESYPPSRTFEKDSDFYYYEKNRDREIRDRDRERDRNWEREREKDRSSYERELRYQQDEKRYQDKYYDEYDRKRYDDRRRSYDRETYRYEDDKNRNSNYSHREIPTRNRSRSPLSKRTPTSNSRAPEKERKPEIPVIDLIMDSESDKSAPITLIDDLLIPPGRNNRPPRLVIIMRGPPGSGKTFLAKLIKDKEVEMGGSAPRILSLDDYFLVETEEEVIEEGRKIKKKKMVYEYEESMENSYRQSLEKAFKKTITDGYFQFIILDCVNDKIKHFSDMWSFAKQNGFQVYICQMELDLSNCTRRNVHFRSEIEIEALIKKWEPTPTHYLQLDATSLLQSGCIPTIEMTVEVSSDDNFGNSENEDEDEPHEHISKWEKMEHTEKQLAQLDGTNKPLRHSSKTMEDYLQWDDEPCDLPDKPGVKKVRWADIEERRKQEKMRAIGFVVGQTDWHRMMDPTQGGSALTQTKYIERSTFNRRY